MTMPVPPGQVPYVTPPLLPLWPTGISFQSIPPGRNVTAVERENVQMMLCQQATGEADAWCNQPLRAVADTEQYHGPGDYRVNIQNGPNTTRVTMQRWPILTVTGVSVCPNSQFPRVFTALPAGSFEAEYVPIGMFASHVAAAGGESGQSVIIAPGWIDWSMGRHGWLVKVQYISGWPHCQITAVAAAGASAITVDDVTGWAPFAAGLTGTSGIIYDAAGSAQEPIQVNGPAGTATGPGTLQLAAPLQYTHEPGVLVSTLPANVLFATALFAAAAALTRGATATTIQESPGRAAGQGGPVSQTGLRAQAHQLLQPYRRVV